MLIANYADAYDAMVSHFDLERKSFRVLVGGSIKTPYGSAFCLITAPLKEIGKEAINV